jgi:hypothetical protein
MKTNFEVGDVVTYPIVECNGLHIRDFTVQIQDGVVTKDLGDGFFFVNNKIEIFGDVLVYGEGGRSYEIANEVAIRLIKYALHGILDARPVMFTNEKIPRIVVYIDEKQKYYPIDYRLNTGYDNNSIRRIELEHFHSTRRK